MQEKEFHIRYRQYAHETALPPDLRSLLELARQSVQNAYAPYSRFQVGAAVRMKNGELLGGANYENASYPLCICAEQSVLAAAASRFPGVPVEAIAVCVQNEKQPVLHPAPPCGACRQVICETERKNGQEIRIVLQGEQGPVLVFDRGGDLLPLAFDGSFL